MLSGIKTTNDFESIINAAVAKKFFNDFVLAGDPTAELEFLQTMGDDLLIIFSSNLTY